MRVDVVTIFPEAFAPLDVSIVRRARAAGVVEVHLHDLRAYAADLHRSVDDEPYGGGAGMVMMAEPLVRALAAVRAQAGATTPRVLLLSPQGERLTQPLARALAREGHLVLLCGRYEGVDERAVALLGAQEVSIGDYVLTGGELPAMVIVDAVVRLLPGAVGDAQSVAQDSFAEGLLDYPHYTRPVEVGGLRVPEVLLSGHHEAIRRWRRKEQLRRTLARRPDLLAGHRFTVEDRELLEELQREGAS